MSDQQIVGTLIFAIVGLAAIQAVFCYALAKLVFTRQALVFRRQARPTLKEELAEEPTRSRITRMGGLV